MGTKSLWIVDPANGGKAGLPEVVVESKPEKQYPFEKELPQLKVFVVTRGTDLYEGQCVLLGQAVNTLGLELPTSPAQSTLLKTLQVNDNELTFDVFDSSLDIYADIDKSTLLRGVIIKATDVNKKHKHAIAAITGCAWCLVEKGKGRYLEWPETPGAGILTDEPTENKVVGLIGGIAAEQTDNLSVALVTLGSGGAGAIALGRLTSGSAPGAVTWKKVQVFEGGTTSMVGEDLTGVVLGEY